MPAHRPPANNDMSMKLITAPPWSDPPMFMCISVGNMRQIARPGPSGLNSSRPVAAANDPRGKSPQLYQSGSSASAVAPTGTPTSSSPSARYDWSLTRSVVLAGPDPSSGPLRNQFLGLGDGFGRVKAL